MGARACTAAGAVLLAAALLPPAPASAPPVASTAAGDSVLAVITHRAGIARRFAHDHLITAPAEATRVTFSAADPAASRFALALPVEHLVADDPAERRRWSPRLLELGILEQPMEELGEKDRAKIRDSMLGPKQLDAAAHPTLQVALAGVREEASRIGPVDFHHALEVDFTIHGVTARSQAAGRVERRDGCTVLEAVGSLTFRAFGIEPYSAALGTVRNRDDFHFYLRLVLDCPAA